MDSFNDHQPKDEVPRANWWEDAVLRELVGYLTGDYGKEQTRDHYNMRACEHKIVVVSVYERPGHHRSNPKPNLSATEVATAVRPNCAVHSTDQTLVGSFNGAGVA
jgi:hypothetical protein